MTSGLFPFLVELNINPSSHNPGVFYAVFKVDLCYPVNQYCYWTLSVDLTRYFPSKVAKKTRVRSYLWPGLENRGVPGNRGIISRWSGCQYELSIGNRIPTVGSKIFDNLYRPMVILIFHCIIVSVCYCDRLQCSLCNILNTYLDDLWAALVVVFLSGSGSRVLTRAGGGGQEGCSISCWMIRMIQTRRNGSAFVIEFVIE